VGVQVREVPTYALYGEDDTGGEGETLHCETIASRSRLHDFHIRPHRHQHLFQLLLLTGGSGRAMLDGAAIELIPPCLVTVPALAVHGYHFSNPVEGLVVTLYERDLDDILRSSPQVRHAYSTPRRIALAGQAATARLIAANLHAVAEECAGHAAGRAAMMQAHLTVACLAAHRALSAPPPVPGAAPPRGQGHVARFRDMIERDFRQRASVAVYADRLGITEVHLRRLCRLHLGTTPLAVLNARTVLEARRLLIFTTLEVKEIASLVGMDDHAYFSRFFRRRTGLAPAAFRARQQRMVPAAAPSGPRHADTRPAILRTGA
jgi:AraC family transcriptional activator of pobA